MTKVALDLAGVDALAGAVSALAGALTGAIAEQTGAIWKAQVEATRRRPAMIPADRANSSTVFGISARSRGVWRDRHVGPGG